MREGKPVFPIEQKYVYIKNSNNNDIHQYAREDVNSGKKNNS